jgi:hypothetical protein
MSPREPREDVSVRTRAGDGGAWARARAWWAQWGELIKGICGVSAAVACIIYAPLVYSLQRSRDEQQKATAKAAKVSCQRSMQYGHPLADFLERERVLSPKDADAYRASIPKSCPK